LTHVPGNPWDDSSRGGAGANPGGGDDGSSGGGKRESSPVRTLGNGPVVRGRPVEGDNDADDEMPEYWGKQPELGETMPIGEQSGPDDGPSSPESLYDHIDNCNKSRSTSPINSPLSRDMLHSGTETFEDQKISEQDADQWLDKIEVLAKENGVFEGAQAEAAPARPPPELVTPTGGQQDYRLEHLQGWSLLWAQGLAPWDKSKPLVPPPEERLAFRTAQQPPFRQEYDSVRSAYKQQNPATRRVRSPQKARSQSAQRNRSQRDRDSQRVVPVVGPSCAHWRRLRGAPSNLIPASRVGASNPQGNKRASSSLRGARDSARRHTDTPPRALPKNAHKDTDRRSSGRKKHGWKKFEADLISQIKRDDLGALL